MHDLTPLVALIDIMCYYLLPLVSNLPHYLCYAYVYFFCVICSAFMRFKSMLLLWPVVVLCPLALFCDVILCGSLVLMCHPCVSFARVCCLAFMRFCCIICVQFVWFYCFTFVWLTLGCHLRAIDFGASPSCNLLYRVMFMWFRLLCHLRVIYFVVKIHILWQLNRKVSLSPSTVW
jgi:hypothetical protein